MPEHLRALVVILGLASVVFFFAKKPACAMAMQPEDFSRRRNLWFAITLTAFLAHNFWIYIVVSGTLLLIALPRERNPLAMYFFILFAVPPISAEITGLGVIRFFFEIGYLRLLALAVLLPAYLLLRIQHDTVAFGRVLSDKFVAGYLILNFALHLWADTFTNSLRVGVFYAFIDVFLPYYVASRSLKNLQHFRDALMAFVVASLILSAVGAFEFARHWLLYRPLENVFGIHWGYGNYLARAEVLRAQASTGQPIPLGYVIAVATCFYLFLSRSVLNRSLWGLGMLLLGAGLVVPFSRGPWLGAGVMLLAFVATGFAAGRRLATVGVLALIAVPAFLATSSGSDFLNLLPFVGYIDAANVSYRQRLLEIGVRVVLQRPLFGAFDFIYSPSMQELKQGEGIIDIVNTYLGVALSSGLIGLSLFVSVFVASAVGVFKGMKIHTDQQSEVHLLGQALLAALLGILVIIFTVSSITVIPVVYWSVAGLGVAYMRLRSALTAEIANPGP